MHQVLYRAILDMHARGVPIDAITLVDDLSRRDQLQAIGGHEAISQVLDSVPHAANARYYAGIGARRRSGAPDRRRQRDPPRRLLDTFTAEQMLESAAGKIEGIVRAVHATAGSSIVWARTSSSARSSGSGRASFHAEAVRGGRPRGIGKSFALCDITAGLRRPGVAVLGGAKAPIGNALYISGEDDPDDTLRPRLRLQGADLKKVAFLTAETLEMFTMACKAKLDKALADMGGECSLGSSTRPARSSTTWTRTPTPRSAACCAPEGMGPRARLRHDLQRPRQQGDGQGPGRPDADHRLRRLAQLRPAWPTWSRRTPSTSGRPFSSR